MVVKVTSPVLGVDSTVIPVGHVYRGCVPTCLSVVRYLYSSGVSRRRSSLGVMAALRARPCLVLVTGCLVGVEYALLVVEASVLLVSSSRMLSMILAHLRVDGGVAHSRVAVAGP